MTTTDHVSDIVIRMKNTFGVTTDKDLAEALGVGGSAISKWRQLGRIPFELIYGLCINKRVSMDWVLFGREADKLKKGSEIDPWTGV